MQDGLGLDPDTVNLRDYDPGWRSAFSDEERALRAALAGQSIYVEHIGSTAVPGIKAKPMIDILIGVESFDCVAAMVMPMKTLGYTYEGDKIVADHHVFSKGPSCSHIVHVVEHGRQRWKELILFRDVLRRNPSVARRYEDYKLNLASRYPDNRRAYREAKNPFIREIVCQYMPRSAH